MKDTLSELFRDSTAEIEIRFGKTIKCEIRRPLERGVGCRNE